MTVTWLPVLGEGQWKNGVLVGVGQEIDENNKIIRKGSFNAIGQLDYEDCEVIDYSDSVNVIIRKGSFIRNKENGTIIEYLFNKSLWEDFKNNSNGINVTKYSRTFSNGVQQSTESTINVNIKRIPDNGNTLINSVGYNFSEN